MWLIVSVLQLPRLRCCIDIPKNGTWRLVSYLVGLIRCTSSKPNHIVIYSHWFHVLMLYRIYSSHLYLWYMYITIYVYIIPLVPHKAGGGSFKDRAPIGEVSCCDSWMAEWTDGAKRGRGSDSLSLSLSIHLSTRLSIYLSIYPSIYPSIYLSIHPSICLSVYLSDHLSICSFICLSVCLSICLFICLSVHLSICLYLSICLFTRLSDYLSIYLSN